MAIQRLPYPNGTHSTSESFSHRNYTERLPGIHVTQKIHSFMHKCESQIIKPMNRLDRNTLGNVYHVSEFCRAIQASMLSSELKWSVSPNYMSSQDKLTETIRAKLIDWLIQIHYNFKLLPETLFLTVNIIDRYFSKHQVSLREVQLVTVAAMLIAAKYEEIYPPLLKDFVYISDNNCSADQILEMEKKILFTIDFDLQLTSPYRFLERFSKLAKIDSVTFYLSQYMLELGLLDSKMNQFPSSL